MEQNILRLESGKEIALSEIKVSESTAKYVEVLKDLQAVWSRLDEQLDNDYGSLSGKIFDEKLGDHIGSLNDAILDLIRDSISEKLGSLENNYRVI